MSEEQRTIIESLIEKAEGAIDKASKAQRLYSKLITTLVGAIIISVGTLAGISWQVVHTIKDVDYVRANAFSRSAAINIEETYRENINALTNLIGDPNLKKIVEEFNRKTDLIITKIEMGQSEIVPRGAKSGDGSMSLNSK